MALRYLHCALFLLCLGRAPAWAEVTLDASVDRRQVEVDEVVQVTVSVSSERLRGLPAPEMPVPEGFQAIGSTSSTSTSISIVDGSMTTTRTTRFVFSYRARREGVFELGPARLSHGGQTYASLPVQVEVVAPGSRAQSQTRPAPGHSAGTPDLREIEENLFLQAIPDRQVAYVGEPVGISYTLFTRFNLQNVQYGHVPAFTGFWAETLFDARRLEMRREVVDGREYNAAKLKRLVLFPATAGTHTLEQLSVVCEIPAPSRSRGLFDFDPFGSFDAFRTRQVTVRSDDLTIEVRPLPRGAPAGFQGAVGRFGIRAEGGNEEVRVGDPLVVKVRVWGTGNVRAIAEPLRPKTDAFRFYDPRSEVEIQVQDDGLTGHKTFEYVLIPQQAGALTLPPFQLVFFDPEKERYQTAKTAPIAFAVRPGEALPALRSGADREPVRILGEDIRFIKPDRTRLSHQGALLFHRGWFRALHLAPLGGLIGAFVFRRHRDRLKGDAAFARRRRARSGARKRLSEANRLRTRGETGAFHAEIHRALAQFLADLLGGSAAGLTADRVVAALAERGVTGDLPDRLRALFAQCDLARFSPDGASGNRVDQVLSEARALVDELDGKI